MGTRVITQGSGMMPPGMTGVAVIGSAAVPPAAGAPANALSPDSYVPPTKDLTRLDRLARLPAKEREEEELSELYRLHGEWILGGGRALFDPATVRLPDMFRMMAAGVTLVVAGERTALTSSLWGTADVRGLNDIDGRYFGNLGQAALARNLAIVTERLDIGIQMFTMHIVPRESKKGERREELHARHWAHIDIDWRRYLYFGALGVDAGFWRSWTRESGYDAFASRYFHGSSLRAWKLASSLLSDDDFARLTWGKEKYTNVKEQKEIRAALIKGLADGSYVGEEGYDQCAKDTFHGNSQKAWQVASSLLSDDDFARLQWRRLKKTSVKEQADIRKSLMRGLEDGSYVGEAGYDRFATERFQGDSQKAWRVASSLLSKDDFAHLQWEKVKFTNIRDEEEIRKALLKGLWDGSYVGEAGYDRFAMDQFQGNSNKAWVVASSLLTNDECAQMAWERVKHTNVREEAEFRAALMRGLEDGSYVDEAGYDRFAMDRFQGDSRKAWRVASSLLSRDDFARLWWGKQKHTNVKEQAEIRATLIKGCADGSYRSDAGYDRFAMEKYQGDSLKAWQVATSLLSKGDFAHLQWEKVKFTNVREQAEIRAALMKGLADGSYVDETGYDRFATARFQGESQMAWQVASSLLSKDDFAQLQWGKQKQTNVNEQADIRAMLIKGLEDGAYVDEAGYDRFAMDRFQGGSMKAWLVASSLLSKDDFARLGWRKQKQTNVREQADIRASLMKGLADGSYVDEAGYDRFAMDRFQGNSQKAWLVASSLLSQNDFARLMWGKLKSTNVRDQAELRAALRSGDYLGHEGQIRFAATYYAGDLSKAYYAARRLLNRAAYKALGWTQSDALSGAYDDEAFDMLGDDARDVMFDPDDGE